MMQQGTLYIISAPSGAGKTSLVNALLKEVDRLIVSVSHTTRAMRAGEKEGVNYFFTNEAHFKEMVQSNLFLETALVFSHWYGTSRQAVQDNLQKGIDVILEIDWQGAEQIRQIFKKTVNIFILPPSREALRDRLEKRGQDSASVIDARMNQATIEMSHYREYEFLVVNDDFNRAVQDLAAIVRAHRLSLPLQAEKQSILIEKLLKSV